MFTLICARLGDGDLAIPLIERLLRTPHGLGLQDLRFSPDWDPLRNDPRFQKILASPEPKVILQQLTDPMFDQLRNDPRFEKIVASEAPKAGNK